MRKIPMLAAAVVVTALSFVFLTRDEVGAEVTVAVEETNCRDCYTCLPEYWKHHNQWVGSYGASHGSACVNGTDCDGHPRCTEGNLTADELLLESEFEERLEGMVAGPDNAVALLDGEWSDRVKLNLDRRALQVESACGDGRIIAHFPLTGEQVAAAILKDPSLTLVAYAGD